MAIAAVSVALTLGSGFATLGPTRTATPSVTPGSPDGDGPEIVWEEIAADFDPAGATLVYAGDRFMAIPSVDGQAVRSSTDGMAWEVEPTAAMPLSPESPCEILGCVATRGGIVMMRFDRRIAILRADGSTASHSFQYPIRAAGIGPTGIIALSGSRDGWFSATGDEWRPIDMEPDAFLDPGVLQITGTSEGFLALSGDNTLWHSNDGVTWQALPGRAFGDLVAWREGVLIHEYPPSIYQYATASVRQPLRMTEKLQALGSRFPPFEEPVTAAGALGIVTLDRAANLALFSPDGDVWHLGPLGDGREWSSGFSSWVTTSVAVGPTAVVAVLAEWTAEGPPSERVALWRATVAP